MLFNLKLLPHLHAQNLPSFILPQESFIIQSPSVLPDLSAHSLSTEQTSVMLGIYKRVSIKVVHPQKICLTLPLSLSLSVYSPPFSISLCPNFEKGEQCTLILYIYHIFVQCTLSYLVIHSQWYYMCNMLTKKQYCHFVPCS